MHGVTVVRRPSRDRNGLGVGALIAVRKGGPFSGKLDRGGVSTEFLSRIDIEWRLTKHTPNPASRPTTGLAEPSCTLARRLIGNVILLPDQASTYSAIVNGRWPSNARFAEPAVK